MTTVTRKVWNNGEGVAHADLNGNFEQMAPLVARVGAQGMLNTMLGVPQEDISPLVAISSDSAPAIIGAIRSSDNPYVNQSFTIGTFAFNDATDAMQQPLWSGYTEARRYTGGGSTLSYEHNIINLADVVASTPYNVAPTGFTTSIWLSSGRNDVPGCVKTSLALGVANNGTPFMAGIVFGADSLDGTIGAAGDAGYGTAMSMARHHQLVWTQPGTGAVAASITSSVTIATGGGTILFTDAGLTITPQVSSGRVEIVLGVLGAITKAGVPSGADLPQGFAAVFKNSSSGAVLLAYNDGGTIKSVALT